MKILAGVFVLAVAALGFYTLTLWFAESLYTRRGSYAYWVCIPRILRNVPEIGHSQDVRFFSSAGDGPKLGETAVIYTTDASPEELTRELGRYFQKLGRPVVFETEEQQSSVQGYPWIRLSIEPVDGDRVQVTVAQVG